MLRSVIIALSLVIGIVMILLGMTWQFWHSPELLWSPEQAKEHTDAWRDYKAAATHGLKVGDPAKDAKLAAAKARYDDIDAKLEQAKALHSHMGKVLSIIGASLIAVALWPLLKSARSNAD